MRVRSLHRLIGLILLVPFFGWAITGLVFFFKPGYAAAYDLLQIKTYPLAGAPAVVPNPEWQEIRYLRTVLGDHVLVKTDHGWLNLDPKTKEPRGVPKETEISALMKDAFSANPARYGEVTSVAGDTITTSTGVVVKLDWARLSLQQKGRDTDRIDWLYRIHYLQWTGMKNVDKVLGFTGLTLVMILTTLGVGLALKRTT